jgi:hypothetical protein
MAAELRPCALTDKFCHLVGNSVRSCAEKLAIFRQIRGRAANMCFHRTPQNGDYLVAGYEILKFIRMVA